MTASDEGVVSRLLTLERAIVSFKERARELASEKARLTEALSRLDGEVTTAGMQAVSLGRSRVEFGDLRQTTPISPVWGLDRGRPLDRYYIENFLNEHRDDIRGAVLEVKDSGYSHRFGGNRVSSFDVIDLDPANANATLVADLASGQGVPSGAFDCFILTQTLGVIFDVQAAVRNACRLLRPGGVLLCTTPAIGRISYEEGLRGDYWRFTEASLQRLFESQSAGAVVAIQAYGNVLACVAFMHGLSAEELTVPELDLLDPYFPVIHAVRAVMPVAPEGAGR